MTNEYFSAVLNMLPICRDTDQSLFSNKSVSLKSELKLNMLGLFLQSCLNSFYTTVNMFKWLIMAIMFIFVNLCLWCFRMNCLSVLVHLIMDSSIYVKESRRPLHSPHFNWSWSWRTKVFNVFLCFPQKKK